MQETGEAVKLFDGTLPTPTPSIQKAIVDAAHQEGMLAVAHAENLNDSLVILKSGVDGLLNGCVPLQPRS